FSACAPALLTTPLTTGPHSDHAGRRVAALLDAEFADAVGGDEAVVDRLDLVRAVPAQPGPAVRGDRVLDAGPPGRDLARGHLAALGGHHGAVPADLLRREPGQPLQLLGDDLALQPPLRARLGVPPVAAAAVSRMPSETCQRP